MSPFAPSPKSSTSPDVRNPPRTTSPRDRRPSGKISRLPCIDHQKRYVYESILWKWYSPECSFYKTKEGCKFGEKSVLIHTVRLMNSPTEGPKIMMTNVQWLCWKIHENWDAYVTSSIFRKISNILKSIRCVQFSKVVLRHANIRDQKQSLGIICPRDSAATRQRSKIWGSVSGGDGMTRAMCSWSSVDTDQKYPETKEENKSTFFSPTEKWCLPSPSKINPEEKEFVVDSDASTRIWISQNWRPWRFWRVRPRS